MQNPNYKSQNEKQVATSGNAKSLFQLPAQLLFEFFQALVAKEHYPWIAIVLNGQVTAEGTQPTAFNAIEIGLHCKRGSDDLFPDVPGIDDSV